jgi:diguanylate cyclase (GGDEF)-like protein/PAS domain S-box-containing protein
MAPIKQSTVNVLAVVFLTAGLLAFAGGTYLLRTSLAEARAAAERERSAVALGDDMYKASDFLTDEVRAFAVTNERSDLDAYWNEITVGRRREAALAQAESLGLGDEGMRLLRLAKKSSDALVEAETHAMRLVSEALDYEAGEMPAAVAALRLPAGEGRLSPAEKISLARHLVFGLDYWKTKREIRGAIDGYISLAKERYSREAREADRSADRTFSAVAAVCLLSFIGGALIVLLYYRLSALPIAHYIEGLRRPDEEAGYPPLRPEGNAELRALATTINLRRSQRLRAERAERDTAIRLRTNLFMMPLGAMEIGVDKRIQSWNPAAERIFGYAEEEALGADIVELTVPERLKAEIDGVIDRINTGAVIDRHINENLRKDGAEIVCEWYNTPLYDSTGALVGWASIVRDITEEKAEADKILYLSRHDPLTGLLNRRSMQERLDEEALRNRRAGGGYATIMVDIDKFKRFNDEHGHECGDQVLRLTAETMSSTLRATDSLGRWGGEEFLVLLPETNLSGALELAEKIRRRIAETGFVYAGVELRLTVTAGAASCGDPQESVDDCIRRADEALLSGKEKGRNRVEAG